MKIKSIIFAFLLTLPLMVRAGGDGGVVTYTFDPHVGGTIVVEAEGAERTFLVTAVPAAGYEFVQWSDGSTTNPRVYTHVDDPEQDKTFLAYFAYTSDIQKKDGHLEINVVDNMLPSFTLTATPNGDATFLQWDDATTDATIPYVESNGQRTAYFVNNLGSPTLVFDQHPGGTISTEHTAGLSFTLTATPADGYSFLAWSDGETDNPRSYTHVADINKDKTLYAVFTLDSDINREFGHLNVTFADNTIPSFDLEAIPDAGAVFAQWENASNVPLFEDYVEAMGNKSAIFINIGGEASYTKDEHEGGTLTISHVEDLTYSILATPAAGYSFMSWSDGNLTNPRVYTHVADVAQDKTLFAVFTKDEDIHRMGGNVNVSITDANAPSFSLEVVEDDGYDFLLWSNGSHDTQIAYVENDGVRFPYFINMVGSVTLIYDQHLGGTVEADLVSGFTYSMTATPNEGYQFMSWSDGNTDNPRTYTHPKSESADATFYAVFTHTKDLSQLGGTTQVTITDAATPRFELEAQASSCASFLAWRDSETEVTRTYVENDGTQIPIFTFGDHYMLNEVENNVGGIIKVDTLTCGYTITAIPNMGYYFSEWEDHSTTALRDVDYVEATYTATFAMAAFRVNGEYYGSFAEAQAVASMTNPITLVSDVLDDIVVSKPVAIDGQGYHCNNLTILNGASVSLFSAIMVNNLYLNATTGSSAQLVNHNLMTCTNAYIDIKLEVNSVAASPDKWYAVCVPFDVDIENGISRASGAGTHISSVDYLVWGYNGTLRSATGSGWEQMLGGTMESGKFYMIGIDGTENTWRFKKKGGSSLCGSSNVDLPAYPGSLIDGGWNAIGNSTLQYADADISNIPFVQVYENGQSRYIPKLTSNTSFVVGAPFFAQVSKAETMQLNASSETNPANLYAPRRANTTKNVTMYYEIRFAQDDIYDAAFISADNEATKSYEIGKDLAKLSLVPTMPQICLINYGTVLCAQNTPFENGSAKFPIYLVAPSNGWYDLSVTTDDDPVYLLKNGVPVTDLSMGTYSVNLTRGTHAEYSLMIGQPRGITTEIENNDEPTNNSQKIIVNGHLYILQNGATYDATGQHLR